MISKEKKTIFLADDDSSFRFAIATELRSLGYVVVTAENGERAINMIRENCGPANCVDLVITDLVMPRKDGMRFCREFRELFKDIPVLVITGFMSHEIRQGLLEIGGIECLEKPFLPEELVHKVEGLIGE